jgi:hypothetical protein
MIREDKGLAPLFWGLCLFWGIRIEESEDPDDGYDFCLPAHPPLYVVMLPEPEDRQVEIASLIHHGNAVLLLDEFDLNDLRGHGSKHRMAGQIEYIARWGTHASKERQKMGIAP